MVPKGEINASLCYKYDNALHAQFHKQMFLIVSEIEKETINLKQEILDSWISLINTEIDINREVRASAETKLLDEKDAERDSYVTYLFKTVRTESTSPFPAKNDAAKRLLLIVNKYKGLQEEPLDEKTLHIIGLIGDFGKTPNDAFTTTLGLEETIDLLLTANTEYQTLKDKRTAERAENKLPAGRTIRPQTDKVYERVCKLIEASYLLSTDEVAKEKITALVSKMNQYILETKTSYKQMHAPHTPSEPDKPDVDPDLPAEDPDLPAM